MVQTNDKPYFSAIGFIFWVILGLGFTLQPGKEPLLQRASKSLDMSMRKDTTKIKTWLALGDSYTIGEFVPFSEGYPMQTSHLLRKESLDMADPKGSCFDAAIRDSKERRSLNS